MYHLESNDIRCSGILSQDSAARKMLWGMFNLNTQVYTGNRPALQAGKHTHWRTPVTAVAALVDEYQSFAWRRSDCLAFAVVKVLAGRAVCAAINQSTASWRRHRLFWFYLEKIYTIRWYKFSVSCKPSHSHNHTQAHLISSEIEMTRLDKWERPELHLCYTHQKIWFMCVERRPSLCFFYYLCSKFEQEKQDGQ